MPACRRWPRHSRPPATRRRPSWAPTCWTAVSGWPAASTPTTTACRVRLPPPTSLEAARPAGEVIDAALAWLDAAPTAPFLLWVHLYDPHAPYEPPEPYRSQYAGRLYDGEVAYASAQVGRLLARLDRRGLTGSTIVVLAGDHGEGLGEHGESTHGMLAYDSTLRVPLVRARARAAPRDRDRAGVAHRRRRFAAAS